MNTLIVYVFFFLNHRSRIIAREKMWIKEVYIVTISARSISSLFRRSLWVDWVWWISVLRMSCFIAFQDSFHCNVNESLSVDVHINACWNSRSDRNFKRSAEDSFLRWDFDDFDRVSSRIIWMFRALEWRSEKFIRFESSWWLNRCVFDEWWMWSIEIWIARIWSHTIRSTETSEKAKIDLSSTKVDRCVVEFFYDLFEFWSISRSTKRVFWVCRCWSDESSFLSSWESKISVY